MGGYGQSSYTVQTQKRPVTLVINQLRDRLSPEQICGELERLRAKKVLHHETTYRHIYRDQKLTNRQDADHELRIGYLRIPHRNHYKKRGKPVKRERIPNRVSIDHRPPIVETNTELGHSEADTVIGKGHEGLLLTLVERCTKFVLIVKLKSQNALALAKEAVKALPFISVNLSIKFHRWWGYRQSRRYRPHR